MASRVLAITVGSNFIRICDEVYMPQKKYVHIYATATVETPEGCIEDGEIKNINTLAKVIKETAEAHNMTTKKVVFSLSSTKIANKEIITPFVRDDKLKSYITTNVTDYFPVNIDDYIISYLKLETIVVEEVKKIRVMVAAAPISLVEEYYDLAALMGVTVEAMDYVGNSTLQLASLQIDERPSLIIQMGNESTAITILNRGVLQLMRNVPYGKETVATALMEKKDIPYEEAYEQLSGQSVLKGSFSENDYVTDSLKYLVNNISRVMDYYTSRNSDNPIEKAYIITEGETITDIEQLFSFELNIHVHKIKALNGVTAEGTSNTSLSALTLYLANIGAVISPIKFESKEAAEKAKTATTNRYLRLVFLAALAIAAIFIIVPLTSYFVKSGNKKSLQKNINAISGVQETVDAYYTARDKYLDIAAYQIMSINPDDGVAFLIDYLEENMPSDISISSFSITGGKVTISCQGSSKQTLADFLTVLKANDGIADVNTAAFSETMDSNGVVTVSYTISFTYINMNVGTEAE